MTAQRPIHEKPQTFRRAEVRGELRLSKSTLSAIRRSRVEKGDPIVAGELAGLLAMKKTPDLIPHCHPVPLTGSQVTIRPTARGVSIVARAEAIYRTGVEMEALVGATVGLLTVWDMVKYLEKDDRGGYPRTRMDAVRVVSKTKTPIGGPS
jgi:cyclic pyranopterin monophosphate synthase